MGRRNARNIPINNAITGSPINEINLTKLPSVLPPERFKTRDFIIISSIGTMMGIEDLNAPGASFNRELISASLISGFASIKVLAAYRLEKIITITRDSALIINPNIKTKPKSAPSIPAAAIGPGVGGTIV